MWQSTIPASCCVTTKIQARINHRRMGTDAASKARLFAGSTENSFRRCSFLISTLRTATYCSITADQETVMVMMTFSMRLNGHEACEGPYFAFLHIADGRNHQKSNSSTRKNARIRATKRCSAGLMNSSTLMTMAVENHPLNFMMSLSND